jgi:hypothetical protein
MNKSLKFFLVGLVIAVLVVLGGLANSYRLESTVKTLESICVEEGKNDISEWGKFNLVCDAESLGMDSVGIQLKVAEAHRKAKQSLEWPYIVAIGILAISIMPLAWYFLLARIRELRDAIAGK